uniref:Uncharacterized protein n=1 Tax=Arundo donax TaxID=35708 RepID=A0A0A9E9D8_ARUDO
MERKIVWSMIYKRTGCDSFFPLTVGNPTEVCY